MHITFDTLVSTALSITDQFIAFLAFLLTSPPLAVAMSSRAEAFTQTGWQRNLDVKKILALYHSEENTSS